MGIQKTIYLDHQATTPVDPHVFEEMGPYFTELFGNPHSSDHCIGWASAQAVEKAAARVARLIGADPDELMFTSGATESNNLALLGLARRGAGSRRRRILLSAIEHKCILAIGRVLQQQFGYAVELIPVDSEGFVQLSALEKALDDDVLAVSIMAVNNEIGTIQNIKKMSELARSHGAIFHSDAAQAPTAMDMVFLGQCADIVSLSSHKMYGPQGIGAIYISRAFQDHIEPLFYGGGQQNGLRSGTVPVALCVGMGAAADILLTEEAERKRVLLRNRCDDFVERLNRLPWPIALNGPKGQARHPGNTNIQFVGFSAHDILNSLQPYVAASTGSACTSNIPEPSHVLKAIGLSGDEAESSIRFSLGFGTTEEDVESAARQIESTLVRLSKAELFHTA